MSFPRKRESIPTCRDCLRRNDGRKGSFRVLFTIWVKLIIAESLFLGEGENLAIFTTISQQSWLDGLKAIILEGEKQSMRN